MFLNAAHSKPKNELVDNSQSRILEHSTFLLVKNIQGKTTVIQVIELFLVIASPWTIADFLINFCHVQF